MSPGRLVNQSAVRVDLRSLRAESQEFVKVSQSLFKLAQFPVQVSEIIEHGRVLRVVPVSFLQVGQGRLEFVLPEPEHRPLMIRLGGRLVGDGCVEVLGGFREGNGIAVVDPALAGGEPQPSVCLLGDEQAVGQSDLADHITAHTHIRDPLDHGVGLTGLTLRVIGQVPVGRTGENCDEQHECR